MVLVYNFRNGWLQINVHHFERSAHWDHGGDVRVNYTISHILKINVLLHKVHNYVVPGSFAFEGWVEERRCCT